MTETIEGLQELQRANEAMIAELQPSGALGRAVKYATTEGHRYAIQITHVDTGTLKAAHRMEVSNVQGRIFIDPSATNPRSGQPVGRYGPIEHDRGGEHAFYQRTIDEQGDQIGGRALGMVFLALKEAK